MMIWTVSCHPMPASDNTVREMLERSATPVIHNANIDSDNLLTRQPIPTMSQSWCDCWRLVVPQPSGANSQFRICHAAFDTPDIHDRRVRQALRHDAPQGTSEVVQGGTQHPHPRTVLRGVGPMGSSIPCMGTTVVSSGTFLQSMCSSRTGSFHTSVGMVDPYHCQFSRDQIQWRICRSGRSSDDWVDVVAHSNAVVAPPRKGVTYLGQVPLRPISFST